MGRKRSNSHSPPDEPADGNDRKPERRPTSAGRQTRQQILGEGLAALRERLGRAGMIQFLQLFDSGHGDHARERRAWVDQTSLADLPKLAAKPKWGRGG